MLISRIFTLAGILGAALWLLIVDAWWFKLPVWRNDPDGPAAEKGFGAPAPRSEPAPVRPVPAASRERVRQEYP